MRSTALTGDDLAAIATEARRHRAQLGAAAVRRVGDELRLPPATRRNLEAGTLAAVDACLALLEDPLAPVDAALYAAHGRAQCAAGRSITELLALYRLSGEAMWEEIEQLPGSERLSGPQALALGGLLLQLVEQLSAAAVDGFLETGAELRRRDRARRDRLHRLLTSTPPESVEAVAAAAEQAGWAVPGRVRVAVAVLPIEADPVDQERAPARVLVGVSPGAGEARLVLIVGDDAPADTEALLTRAATAHGARGTLAVGPAVPTVQAARSARLAGHLLDQIRTGAVADAPVVRSDDHELALLLAAAPELVSAIVERRLAPLADLPQARRLQTLQTLAAWLADPHRPQAIADRLGMHVQSVRYRLARLRELFGDALDDPHARFELQIALRGSGVAPTDSAEPEG